MFTIIKLTTVQPVCTANYFKEKKKMKKLLLFLLVIFVIAACVACGGKDPVDSDTNTDVSSDSDTDTNTEVNSDSDTDTNTEVDSDSDTDQVISYTITWLDENGNQLKQDTVEEGQLPSYTYTKADTAEWDYTVNGWSESLNGTVLSSIPAASKNASYYASVTKVKQKYTVTFNSNGGSAVDSQVVEYGSLATLPAQPEYEGHKFVGWSTDDSGNTAVDFSAAITGNVEYFAIWNELVNVKALLSALLNGYELDPYSYFPESMLPNYSDNLVDESDIIDSYSSFVNVSSVTYGFGEQYHMVLDNLEQSKLFFNVLTVVESLSATSVSAFNNYFDQNPADTAHHTFKSGIYNITIDFDGEVIYYVIDYTDTIPVLGQQTVQIALSMIMETGEKTVRVQLGDANAISYTITENAYEFAIKYLGVRRAMISLARDDNDNVTGSIYEYLTYEGVGISSCADFYITEDYVSVVGNKASGLIGFTGYINELYDTDSGKLLGYEVQETLSKITYNTLWFNLSDINGISSIKYQPAQGQTEAKVYVNGSSSVWETMTVGLSGGFKAASRRFDIEMRTQYVYSYDATEGKYVEHATTVPMIFVQEEQYDTFVKDVKSTNNVTISVNVSNSDLNKILSDYDNLIPVFIVNKDKVTEEAIVEYIGEKIVI